MAGVQNEGQPQGTKLEGWADHAGVQAMVRSLNFARCVMGRHWRVLNQIERERIRDGGGGLDLLQKEH